MIVQKGVAAFAVATFRARTGKPALEPLRQAAAAFQRAVEMAPQVAEPREHLARTALLRGHLADASARAAALSAGLLQAAAALERDPRNPRLLTLRARLEALAGERAAARQSLDRAYAAQPLLRGNPDARAAEAELAAAR